MRQETDMRSHTSLYESIAKRKVASEQETQETPVVNVQKMPDKKQSIPNAAAIRRSHRDTVLSRTLDFENV
jgi:hypothetical protein